MLHKTLFPSGLPLMMNLQQIRTMPSIAMAINS